MKQFHGNIEFVKSATSVKQLPNWPINEVAFVGRSNVGKSSLINLIANNSGLAKVSNTPGKTQLINLFKLDNRLCLVDLPGYGYAKVAGKTQNSWRKMMENYLTNRLNIYCIFVLIDSRHELKTIDVEMLEWLEHNNLAYKLILTKCDKKDAQIKYWEQKLAELATQFPNMISPAIYTSAEKKTGVNELRKYLIEVAESKSLC